MILWETDGLSVIVIGALLVASGSGERRSWPKPYGFAPGHFLAAGARRRAGGLGLSHLHIQPERWEIRMGTTGGNRRSVHIGFWCRGSSLEHFHRSCSLSQNGPDCCTGSNRCEMQKADSVFHHSDRRFLGSGPGCCHCYSRFGSLVLDLHFLHCDCFHCFHFPGNFLAVVAVAAAGLGFRHRSFGSGQPSKTFAAVGCWASAQTPVDWEEVQVHSG